MSKIFWNSILTAFGLGLIPKAPGTWGALGALVVYSVLLHYQMHWIVVGSLVGLFILSIIAFRQLKVETDASSIVMDEWVAMGMTLFATDLSVAQIIIAFVLFRIFDIAKPPGVRFFDERFFRGWGVMLDDIVAALYAMAILGAWNVFGSSI